MNIHKPLRLMIPGPVSVHPDVLAALGGPVQPHYGPAFRDLFNETLGLLRGIFNTQGDVYLMAGSGTAGIDACIGSALRSGEKILVGANGFFGERLVDISARYGLNVVPIRCQPGIPLSAEDFLNALREHPDARAAAIVHLETGTTIINPIHEIGPALADSGLYFIVDAVSSLGGVPFHMDDWHIDLVASATQKCLGSPPGLSPVAISKRAWEAIDRVPESHNGWFSDLRVWRKYYTEWGDWHPTPVTMPVNIVSALNVALLQLQQEGLTTRLERYERLGWRLREGLAGIGLGMFTPPELMNPVLTAAYVPEGMPSSKVVSYLENEHQIKISTGLGELKEKMIRVGHMSPVVTEEDIDDVVLAIAEVVPA